MWPMTSASPRTKALGPRSAAASFEHRPSLDGIRAVAALLVILFHAGMPSMGHGYVGVDVFFVLSGFLITSLLVRELLSTGRLQFVAFYARRVRRLLPAALVVLLVTAVAYELVASPLGVSENRGGFVAAALYVSNWYFLAESKDYFAEEAEVSPVQHYWSLSVEEQFYLVWPAVVLVLVLAARRYRLPLDLAAGVLAVAGLVYAGVLAGGDPMGSYFGTPARAYQLLLGAAIALLILRWEERVRAGTRLPLPARVGGSIAAAAGLALVLAAGSPLLSTGSAYWHGVGAALGTTLLILGLELAPASQAGRALAWGPARRVGLWSYAAYLWHWPVVIVAEDAGVLPQAWLPRVLLVVAVTLLLSAATFSFVERPTRHLSLRTMPRQRVVASFGVVLAVGTALVLPGILRVDSRAEAVLDVATEDPGRLAAISDGEGSDASTVLLVGDSHAKYLYPALAELAKAQGWSLVPSIEDACPWPRVQATARGVVLDCETMRRNALAAAERSHPDIAVLVSRSIVRRPLKVGGELVDPGGPGWLRDVSRGTEAFLAALRPLVGRIVIVEVLPETSEPMVDCLSTGADPASCAAPAVHRPGTIPLRSLWRTLPGVTTVGLDELLCPDGICPAMVDGIPTYRDTNHLTVDYSRHIARRLDKYLRSQGIVLAAGEVRAN
jgi:peptidoglycan/LPS O-acetylase OafA/YrhL